MQNTTENDIITPLWNENVITIAMSSSQMYSPYLSVCLQSLKEHTTETYNYDIIIFTSEINDETKKILKDQIEEKNISIRFVNPKPYFENIKLTVSKKYFKEECYYRVVAPLIFKNYDKIIFTDIDLLFEHDIKDLYNISLNDKPIAACIDLLWHGIINTQESLKTEYAIKTLGLTDPYKYVNTGVLIIDIKKCLETNFTQNILKLINNNQYETQEQCAINALLKENIKYLDFNWNASTKPTWIKNKMTYMSDKTITAFNEAYNNPKIIHFMGPVKPWNTPQEDRAYKWWEYARRTPFYETILFRIYTNPARELPNQIKHAFNYQKNCLSYWRYKILYAITFGKTKEHYKNKKALWKNKVRIGKEFRKG